MTRLSLSKNNLTDGALVDLLHVQIPRNEYICRYTFRVEEKKDKELQCICKNCAKGYLWEKYDELTGFKTKVDKFWAIEPVLLFDKILAHPNQKDQVLQEITFDEMTKYLSDEVKLGDHPLSTLLVKLGYKDDDLYRCFLDYLNSTYPSMYMNKLSFQEWAVKSGLLQFVYLPDRVLPAFQIDPSKDATLGYIEFDEFLFGMLFIDADCPREAPFIDIHLSYVFRYYNRGKNMLEFDDLVSICKDIEAVNFKNVGPALLAAKKKYQTEAEAFWKEAGLKQEKGVAMNWTKFQATYEKLAKSAKFLNMDNVLRSQKSLLMHEQQNDQLARISSLGRDYLDIYSKRDLICGECEQKEPCKWAEHTVKVFYNGAITELYENEKWIPDLKLRANKAKRKTSNSLFSEDYFPNVLHETIGSFVEQSAIRNTRPPGSNPKQQPLGSNNEWSGQFVNKYLSKIYELLNEMSSLCDSDLVRLSSPCAVCPDFSKLSDLFTMERHFSQVVSFAFPLRYVYMLTWNDFTKNGLELILLLVAKKILLPDKYYLILAKVEGKKMSRSCFDLTRQYETGLSKEAGDKLVDTLLKLMDKLPKCALIDETVCLLPGVDKDNQKDYLDSALANFELSSAVACRKEKRGKKGKKAKSEVIPVASESEVTSKLSFIIFTSNAESSTKKLVSVHTPEDQIYPIGKDKSGSKEGIYKHLVILVEAEKIRPLYLVKEKE